jgi:hypothetical protein
MNTPITPAAIPRASSFFPLQRSMLGVRCSMFPDSAFPLALRRAFL